MSGIRSENPFRENVQKQYLKTASICYTETLEISLEQLCRAGRSLQSKFVVVKLRLENEPSVEMLIILMIKMNW